MTGLELERAVEALAADCDECRTRRAQLESALHDVHDAARKAARRRSADELAACRRAREVLAELRDRVRTHLHDHHQMKEARTA